MFRVWTWGICGWILEINPAKMRLYPVLFLALACLFACSSDLETVEQRNDQNQLIRFQRRKSDFARQGVYQRFYPSGILAEEAVYVHDTLDGPHKYFYTNGNLESIEHLKMGVFHGKYQKFYENGVLELEQEFVDGAMQGLSLRYYPNGILGEKVTIRDNEENGPFTEYHENGQLKAEGTYRDGPTEQGELREYDESGQLIRIADCTDGMCVTRWKKEE